MCIRASLHRRRCRSVRCIVAWTATGFESGAFPVHGSIPTDGALGSESVELTSHSRYLSPGKRALVVAPTLVPFVPGDLPIPFCRFLTWSSMSDAVAAPVPRRYPDRPGYRSRHRAFRTVPPRCCCCGRDSGVAGDDLVGVQSVDGEVVGGSGLVVGPDHSDFGGCAVGGLELIARVQVDCIDERGLSDVVDGCDKSSSRSMCRPMLGRPSQAPRRRPGRGRRRPCRAWSPTS